MGCQNNVEDDSLRNWMLFLSGYEKTKEALAMNDVGISKAYEELQHVSHDEVMCEFAFKREKFLFEQSMRLDAAKDQGLKRGLEQGSQEALETTARNLLAIGVDVEVIAKGTGLSLEEVYALKGNMH